MDRITRRLYDYFSLAKAEPVFGGPGIRTIRQPILFLGVLLGAIAKITYDSLQDSSTFELKPVGIAAIVSIVIFPKLYYSSGLNKGELNFAKWCLAFQHGFFWEVVIQEIGQAV